MQDTAVIGAGRWGRNHVRDLNKMGRLSWVCDTDPALEIRSIDKSVSRATDIGAILADPKTTKAIVATPPGTHYEITMELLDAGKDVLVEKPMALSVDDCQVMTRTAAKFGRILAVGHLLHFHPAYATMKAFAQMGRIGKIRKITASRYSDGIIRTDHTLLESFGPHDISCMLEICPGNLSSIRSKYDPIRKDLHTGARCDYTGIEFEYHCSWKSPVKFSSFDIYGTQGSLSTTWGNRVWGIMDRDTNVMIEASSDASPLERQLQHFFNCCETREEPRVSGYEGARTMRAIFDIQSKITEAP